MVDAANSNLEGLLTPRTSVDHLDQAAASEVQAPKALNGPS